MRIQLKLFIHGQFEDFHPAWRQRQCLINCWLCLTVVLLLFCPMGVVGALVAFIGACLYACRCCRPKVKGAGLSASKYIFVLAVLSSLLDAMILSALLVIGILFISSKCIDSTGQELGEDACNVRRGFGVGLCCMGFVALIHLLMSVSVFFSMRTCHRRIQA